MTTHTLFQARWSWSVPLLIIGSLAAAGCEKPKREPPAAKTVAAEKEAEPAPAPAPAPVGAGALAEIAGRYEIDPIHTAVIWKIRHMGVSDTIGRFNKAGGFLVLDADPAKSSVALEVDAASVYTADKKRDDHLKSPDFLNVKQFPAIKFTSTSITATGDKTFDVAGDLELHGVKKPVTAKFELIGAGPNMMDKSMSLVGFTGEFDIKRSDFEMSNMMGPVGDDVQMTIAVEAGKKK